MINGNIYLDYGAVEWKTKHATTFELSATFEETKYE